VLVVCSGSRGRPPKDFAQRQLDTAAEGIAGRSAGLRDSCADRISEIGVQLCVVDDVWNAAALHTVPKAIPDRIAVLVISRLKIGVEHQVEVDALVRPRRYSYWLTTRASTRTPRTPMPK